MTDAEIILGLGRLGVDRDSYRVLTFLPLVQVAWADGKIQPAERRIIEGTAARYGCAEGRAGDVLKRWLTERPGDRFFTRGRQLLVALAHKHRGLGAEIQMAEVADLVDLCEDVAHAAGGLFGLFPVHVQERRAITEIMSEIGVPPDTSLNVMGQDWADLD